MAERQAKPELLPHKKTIKLTPAIGDWTTYHPPKTYAKRIKSGLYGFDRLSEERLTKALLLHYELTREFLNLLKINLMLTAEFYSISAEQTNYLNFLRSANYPLVHLKINLPDWHSSISICLDLAIVNSLINQSLGSTDTDPLARKLTELEGSILDIAIKEYLIPLLEKRFKKVLGKMEVSAFNSPDISSDNAVNPSNSFVSFNINVSLADNPPGKIQIGYAGNLLKNLLKKLEEVPDTKPLPFSKLPPKLLNSISIPVSVTLGATEIGTGELRQMETGDVVALDNTLETPVAIKVGDKINLLGQPGKKGKKVSCRIVSLEKEEKVKIEATPTLDEQLLEEEKEEEYPNEETISKAAGATIETPVDVPLEEEFDEDEEEDEEEDVLTEDSGEEEFDEDEEEDEEELSEDENLEET